METEIIEEKTGKTVATLVENLTLKKHGTPRLIISDSGCEFTNKYIEELKNTYNFNWYNRSAGLIERTNQIFMNKIRYLTNYGDLKRENFVEQATFAYNISFQRSI